MNPKYEVWATETDNGKPLNYLQNEFANLQAATLYARAQKNSKPNERVTIILHLELGEILVTPFGA